VLGVICALLIGLTCSVSKATTIYDSFGGEEYAPSCPIMWEYDEGFTMGICSAFQFTVAPGTDYTLNSVTLVLAQFMGVENVKISIRDNNGVLPNTLVEKITENPGNITDTPTALTYNSTDHPTLSAGTTYWLTLEPKTENTVSDINNCMMDWYTSNTASVSGATKMYMEGSWGEWGATGPELREGAFRIIGTAVPEPSSIAFFGIGLLGLIGGWIRRRAATRNT